jgi:hypothetical protein
LASRLCTHWNPTTTLHGITVFNLNLHHCEDLGSHEDFLDWHRIVCHEFIAKGAMVKKDKYKEFLTYLLEEISLKHPKIGCLCKTMPQNMVATLHSSNSPGIIL